MTREFLERYQDIKADVAATKSRYVRDTVQTSSPEPPYEKHTIGIKGLDQSQATHLKQLCDQLATIELAIEEIPDDLFRAISKLRIIGGLCWNDVNGQLGGKYTVDGLKKIYQRGMKKYF